MPGQFFFIVGPSGAGKDSLIHGVWDLLPPGSFHLARRVITRVAMAQAEDHDSCTVERFLERERNGEFLITWQAHGLHYGLPMSLLQVMQSGRHIIANGSRHMITELISKVLSMQVIEVTAPVHILRARLQGRQRESAEDIEKRLERAHLPLPVGVLAQRVVNDLSLEMGVSRLKAALLEAHSATPEPQSWLFQKINGKTLPERAYEQVLPAIIRNEFDLPDVQAFLIACTQQLTEDEVVAITKARTLLYPRLKWHRPMVVDKHSMGGIPGSRVTMVVIPIVASHGLLIPKTSSRAITSAAGTADAMEVLARVDLDFEEVRKCVQASNGCIAWNGKLNHSVLDEAMNAMVKPLGLDTRNWSVASILSKKYTAGATHVVIDIPYADQGKVKTEPDARALADLFERTGAAIGLVVKAFATPGNAPIGRGIGPALEARDVMRVLNNDPQAPDDLRDKALFFAGQILALDPEISDLEHGMARAEQLLRSGSARQKMQEIMTLQGPMQPPQGRVVTHEVKSTGAGRVKAILGHVISNVARAAGAPQSPLAGVDLIKKIGDQVQTGDVLYVIQSTNEDALERAKQLALEHEAYVKAEKSAA